MNFDVFHAVDHVHGRYEIEVFLVETVFLGDFLLRNETLVVKLDFGLSSPKLQWSLTFSSEQPAMSWRTRASLMISNSSDTVGHSSLRVLSKSSFILSKLDLAFGSLTGSLDMLWQAAVE